MSKDVAEMTTLELLEQQKHGTATARRAATAEQARRYATARIVAAQLADAPTEALVAELGKRLGDKRERLAEYAHTAWSEWMIYLFNQGDDNPDDTWTMPAWAVERWRRQMLTAYAELPPAEQESDRAEADRMLSAMGIATRLPFEVAPSPYIVPPRPGCRCYLCRLRAMQGDRDVE